MSKAGKLLKHPTVALVRKLIWALFRQQSATYLLATARVLKRKVAPNNSKPINDSGEE